MPNAQYRKLLLEQRIAQNKILGIDLGSAELASTIDDAITTGSGDYSLYDIIEAKLLKKYIDKNPNQTENIQNHRRVIYQTLQEFGFDIADETRIKDFEETSSREYDFNANTIRLLDRIQDIDAGSQNPNAQTIYFLEEAQKQIRVSIIAEKIKSNPGQDIDLDSTELTGNLLLTSDAIKTANGVDNAEYNDVVSAINDRVRQLKLTNSEGSKVNSSLKQDIDSIIKQISHSPESENRFVYALDYLSKHQIEEYLKEMIEVLKIAFESCTDNPLNGWGTLIFVNPFRTDLSEEDFKKTNKATYDKAQDYVGILKMGRLGEFESLKPLSKLKEEVSNYLKHIYQNSSLTQHQDVSLSQDETDIDQVCAKLNFNNLIDYLVTQFEKYEKNQIERIKQNIYSRNTKDNNNNLHILQTLGTIIDVSEDEHKHTHQEIFQFLQNPKYDNNECVINDDVNKALKKVFGINKDDYKLKRVDIEAISDLITSYDLDNIFDLAQHRKTDNHATDKLSSLKSSDINKDKKIVQITTQFLTSSYLDKSKIIGGDDTKQNIFTNLTKIVELALLHSDGKKYDEIEDFIIACIDPKIDCTTEGIGLKRSLDRIKPNPDTNNIATEIDRLYNQIFVPLNQLKITQIAAHLSAHLAQARLDYEQQILSSKIKFDLGGRNDSYDDKGKKISRHLTELNIQANSAKTTFNNSSKTHYDFKRYQRQRKKIFENYAQIDPSKFTVPTSTASEPDNLNDKIFDFLISKSQQDFLYPLDGARNLRQDLISLIRQHYQNVEYDKHDDLGQEYEKATTDSDKEAFFKRIEIIIFQDNPFINHSQTTTSSDLELTRNALYEKLNTDNRVMLNSLFSYYPEQYIKQFTAQVKSGLENKLIPNQLDQDQLINKLLISIFEQGQFDHFSTSIDNILSSNLILAETQQSELQKIYEIIEDCIQDPHEKTEIITLLRLNPDFLQKISDKKTIIYNLKPQKYFNERQQYRAETSNAKTRLKEYTNNASASTSEQSKSVAFDIYSILYSHPYDLLQSNILENPRHKPHIKVNDQYDLRKLGQTSTFIENVLLASPSNQLDFKTKLAKKTFDSLNDQDKLSICNSYILSQYQILLSQIKSSSISDVNRALENNLLKNFLEDEFAITITPDSRISSSLLLTNPSLIHPLGTDNEGNDITLINKIRKFSQLKEILFGGPGPGIEILGFVNNSNTLPQWYQDKLKSTNKNIQKKEFSDNGSEIRDLYQSSISKNNYEIVKSVIKSKDDFKELHEKISYNESKIEDIISYLKNNPNNPRGQNNNQILLYSFYRAQNDLICKTLHQDNFTKLRIDYIKQNITDLNKQIANIESYFFSHGKSLEIADILSHYDLHKSVDDKRDLYVTGLGGNGKIDFKICEIIAKSYRNQNKHSYQSLGVQLPDEIYEPLHKLQNQQEIIRIKNLGNQIDKLDFEVNKQPMMNAVRYFSGSESSRDTKYLDSISQISKSFSPVIDLTKYGPAILNDRDINDNPTLQLKALKNLIKAAIALNMENEIINISQILPERGSSLEKTKSELVIRDINKIYAKIDEYYQGNIANHDQKSIDHITLKTIRSQIFSENRDEVDPTRRFVINGLFDNPKNSTYDLTRGSFVFSAKAINLSHVEQHKDLALDLYKADEPNYAKETKDYLKRRQQALNNYLSTNPFKSKPKFYKDDIELIKRERDLEHDEKNISRINAFFGHAVTKVDQQYNKAIAELEQLRKNRPNNHTLFSQDDIDLDRKKSMLESQYSEIRKNQKSFFGGNKDSGYINAKKDLKGKVALRKKQIEEQLKEITENERYKRKLHNLVDKETSVSKTLDQLRSRVRSVDVAFTPKKEQIIKDDIKEINAKLHSGIKDIEKVIMEMKSWEPLSIGINWSGNRPHIIPTSKTNEIYHNLIHVIYSNIYHLDSGTELDESIFNAKLANIFQGNIKDEPALRKQKAANLIRAVKDIYYIAKTDPDLKRTFKDVLATMANKQDFVYKNKVDRMNDALYLLRGDYVNTQDTFLGHVDNFMINFEQKVAQATSSPNSAQEFDNEGQLSKKPSNVTEVTTSAAIDSLIRSNETAFYDSLSVNQDLKISYNTKSLKSTDLANSDNLQKIIRGVLLSSLQSHAKINTSSNFEMTLREYITSTTQNPDLKQNVPDLSQLDEIFSNKLKELGIFKVNDQNQIAKFHLCDLTDECLRHIHQPTNNNITIANYSGDQVLENIQSLVRNEILEIKSNSIAVDQYSSRNNNPSFEFAQLEYTPRISRASGAGA